MPRSYGREAHLFSKASWSDALRHNEQKLSEKVRSMSLAQIGDDIDLCAQTIAAEFDFSPPTLDREGIAADPIELQQQVNDYGTLRTLTRQAVEVTVPYQGEKEAFNLRPSRYNLSPPYVILGSNELTFRIFVGDRDSQKLRAEIDKTVDEIQWFIDQQQMDANGQTERLVALAHRELAARKDSLTKNSGVVAGLGFKSKGASK